MVRNDPSEDGLEECGLADEWGTPGKLWSAQLAIGIPIDLNLGGSQVGLSLYMAHLAKGHDPKSMSRVTLTVHTMQTYTLCSIPLSNASPTSIRVFLFPCSRVQLALRVPDGAPPVDPNHVVVVLKGQWEGMRGWKKSDVEMDIPLGLGGIPMCEQDDGQDEHEDETLCEGENGMEEEQQDDEDKEVEEEDHEESEGEESARHANGYQKKLNEVCDEEDEEEEEEEEDAEEEEEEEEEHEEETESEESIGGGRTAQRAVVVTRKRPLRGQDAKDASCDGSEIEELYTPGAARALGIRRRKN